MSRTSPEYLHPRKCFSDEERKDDGGRNFFDHWVVFMYLFHVPSIFTLNWPRSIIITLGKDLVQLNPIKKHNGVSKIWDKKFLQSYFLKEWELLSAANEVIRREGVAIPDNNIQFSKAFDECADELFLERWVLTSIYTTNWKWDCVNSSSKPVNSVGKNRWVWSVH